MRPNRGLVQSERSNTAGNGALLVIVNSAAAFWDHFIVDETVLVALEHFGMPYRLLDLASERPTPDALANCAAVILAQCKLGSDLTEAETRLISDAVRDGAGLVNFDSDIRLYKPALLEVFGFEGINPHPYATNLVRIRETQSYISQMQTPGEFHEFDRMATGVIVERWRKDVTPLAESVLGKEQLVYIRHLTPWSAFEPRNHAAAFAARWGKGKAVQFALSPRIWRTDVYGHTRGLDDLFWRSIVWAARKPFAANMVPPFVTMSFDDCSGRHDFAWVDVCVNHGYTPIVSLFLRDTPARLFPRIRDGLRSGRVEYGTHALDYYTLMYSHYGRGECTLDELRANFAFEDAWWRKVGAAPGQMVRGHMGERGLNALPFLKERGRVFFCPARQVGVVKADQDNTHGYWPYDLPNWYYDYLPDDHDFFVFSSQRPRFQEDFLAGCTPILRESDRVDVEKAAQSAARCVREGLRGAFFAEMVTHEQKFETVSVEDWDRILTRTDQLTAGIEIIHAGHDEIGRYLKSKDSVRITEAAVEGGRIRCAITGDRDAPLRMSVFRDEGEGVAREYAPVAPSDTEARA